MIKIKTNYDYVLLHAQTYNISTYQWCKVFELVSQITDNYDKDEEISVVYTTESQECENICDALRATREIEIYNVDATNTPRAGQLPNSIDILICDATNCSKYTNIAKNIIDINNIGRPTYFNDTLSQTERDAIANRCLRKWMHICLPNDKQSITDLTVSW